MKKLNFLLSFFVITLLITSCDKKARESASNSLLPQAQGDISEIILVMDSAKWAGKLGDELKNILRSPMPGLPQDEPRYTVRYINPYSFTSILKQARNVIFVTSLEDKSSSGQKLKSYFTKESLDRINKDPKLFMYSKKDEFAKGQEVLHLFGKTDQELIQNLSDNKGKIIQHLSKIEKERLIESIYKGGHEKGIGQMLRNKYQFGLKVPKGYEIAIEEEDFIWLRKMDHDVDKSIFISYTNYTSEEVFEDKNIINLRNTIAKKHLYGDPENLESFVITEHIMPPVHTTVNFNNKYAVETRGLWKTNNISMGGPFISYTVVDEKLGRLYYIEGFVYGPGKNKRDFMKEMEAILWTYNTSTEMVKDKK
jgi:hypothetical protein